MYHAGAGKELLAFGQAIQVGEHNVRVERHLSQGGFAHVYLVRSDRPVGGTTQHVLKHIRVANEPMLNEVRKEVDIMRLLRGHPNIVHLIDAAWSKTPTGPSAYEVFILMEFCPGGGIIDMMNRRLRERLTEQEILQIFVDVCEALAFMHNLRPALLHRDLKVENILQASSTKYKLCDFGSATPVAQRPPSTLQEIQALGADLDRHTTLQYRAPEMIDPNLRRPIDEKSDVWALGVLLYKLCYYTTPFEEHGPLAILNVQYTTPPYPVYSTQMNQLIGLMLQEYGAHRPSVFDLLDRVHAMRGTRSQNTYNRAPVSAIPAAAPPKSSLDGILVRNQAQSAPVGAGAAAARKQVLDAIAPMRRGRPEVQSHEDRAWEAVKAKEKADDSAWDLAALNVKRVEAKSPAVVSPSAGFGDSFKPSIRNAHAPTSPPLPPSVYGTISPPPPATSTTPQPRPGTLATPSYYPSALRAPSAPLQDTRKSTPTVSGRPADVELSAEERFPSLEALDRAFSPPSTLPPASNIGAPTFGRDQGPGLAPTPPLRGARSQQVTGVAMKDPSPPTLPPKPAMLPTGHAVSAISSPDVGARPSLRRHRSSVAIKSPVLASSSSVMMQPKAPRKEQEQPTDWLTGDQHESTHRHEESRTAPGKLPQQDWLTGEFDEPQPPPAHVARSSLNGPRQMGPRPLPTSPAKPAPVRRTPSPKPPLPPRPTARADSPEPIKEETQSAFARASVFREETRSAFRHSGLPTNGESYLGARPLPSEPLRAAPSPAPAPVKTSPRETGLTDNWSPVEDRHPPSQQQGNSSSSDEEKGPEDVTPARRSVLEPKQRKSKIRPKGRTSSVHDLVDLWSTDSGAAPAKTGDRLERPPSRQTGVGVGPKRSPGPSPVLRPTPAPKPPSPAKARPQSMFLYGSGGSTLSPPTQQSSNAFTALSHQTPSAPSPQNLAAPPQDAARQRSSRRGSISDMVEKYEALVTPRSPATPRWSPVGGGAGQIALPGLATPSAAPVGRTSPGLSVQQRRVSTGRISPASSTTSASTNTSSTSAFHGRGQPIRKNTAPPASPSKAPPSPTKTAFNFGSGYTGGAARTATPVINTGTPKPASSHTPKPSGSSTPRPTTNFTGAKTAATGIGAGAGTGVRNILTGTALRTTTTGSVGVKPVTTGSTGVKPVTTGNIAGINLKPITTGLGGGVKTSTTGVLRTPTSATAPFAPGHGRQSSTSVLFGKPSTPVPSSPVTLVSPIPVKPSSLSRRPGPPLKSITPPREANGGPVQPIASPTPDRPYTGVSKLIDQWQRKTEEAGTGAPRTGSYKSKG